MAKPIPVVVPEHLRGIVPIRAALAILRESRKRNVLNKEHIAHITLEKVIHPNGSVSLVPVVVAKPLPDGVQSSMIWPVYSGHRRYFTD